MRSAIIAAAFAAGALAVPYEKRDIVTNTEVDYVYTTDVVTVTAGDEPLPSAATTVEYTTQQTVTHYGHNPTGGHVHYWWSSWSQQSQQTSQQTEAPAPTQTYEAPTTSSTSTWEQPTTTPESSPTTQPNTSPAKSPKTTQTQPVQTSATAAPTGYNDITVYHHNLHRANHTAPNIEWDDGLATIAASIASNCYYKHNVTAGGGGYGQNIAAGVEANNISAIITNLFYNGEVGWFDGLYGQAQPSMNNFELWGHFSQIVWKDTSHVGCATQDCSAQGLGGVTSDVSPYFTVCNYKSPGNYANEYGDNIGEPLGHPTANWNTGMS